MAFKKMNPELKAKWLRALRGGKYKQAHHALKDTFNSGVGYCCLGVLCNISKAGKWDRLAYVTPSGNRNINYIPGDLLPEFGLTKETQKKLSVMNDNRQMTFSQIADWVETNL